MDGSKKLAVGAAAECGVLAQYLAQRCAIPISIIADRAPLTMVLAISDVGPHRACSVQSMGHISKLSERV